MMVIRSILRFLLNNEQLIHRLSETGPIRSSAKFVAFLLNRGKSIAEEKGLNEKLSTQNLTDIAKKISNDIKNEIKQGTDKLKKKF